MCNRSRASHIVFVGSKRPLSPPAGARIPAGLRGRRARDRGAVADSTEIQGGAGAILVGQVAGRWMVVDELHDDLASTLAVIRDMQTGFELVAVLLVGTHPPVPMRDDEDGPVA